MDNTEIIKRRRRAKMRMRALFRLIIITKILLEKRKALASNFDRKIPIVLRRHRKSDILTVAEKTLINTPRWMRTKEQSKELVLLVASLNCFKDIPPKVRARIAPYLFYLNIEAGRTIMKEGDDRKCAYFILKGEVTLKRLEYDPIKEKMVPKYFHLLEVGDKIGEIGYLEHTKRQYTYTSCTHLELLMLWDDEFEQLLLPTYKEIYDQKLMLIQAYYHFDRFLGSQTRLAARIGVLKQFEPTETIYHEDQGITDYVYFVLNGECMILQNLKIQITELASKQKRYQLCKVDEDSSKSLESTISVETLTKTKSSFGVKKLESNSSLYSGSKVFSDHRGVSLIAKYVPQCSSAISKVSIKTKSYSMAYLQSVHERLPDEEDNPDREHVHYGMNRKDSIHSAHSIHSADTSYNSVPETAKRNMIEHHFVDVGTLSYGAVFGLGEEMVDRAIVARSVVQCFLLPRNWLFKRAQNPGNVWQRTILKLNSAIPSREELFKDFVARQKWKKLKTDFIKSELGDQYITTKIEDIPAICRIIEETFDDD